MTEATEGFCLFATPIGECGIAWREALVIGVQLPGIDADRTRSRMRQVHPELHEVAPPAWIASICKRVAGLLAGDGDSLLDVPLDMQRVSEFHRRVYEIARAIPPGRTVTYGDIASRLGDMGLARAVGQALGLNPFAPVVPCHRILGAGNSGTGFSASGGVATKLKMLEIERAQLGPQRGLFD